MGVNPLWMNYVASFRYIKMSLVILSLFSSKSSIFIFTIKLWLLFPIGSNKSQWSLYPQEICSKISMNSIKTYMYYALISIPPSQFHRWLILTICFSNLSIWCFFLCQELSPIHLKEPHYGFSLAHPNCQNLVPLGH